MKATHVVSFILVAIGGLNWGLVGLGSLLGGSWNVVHFILGFSSTVENLVYVLVGIATLVLIFTHKRDCAHCKADASSAPTM